MFTMAITALESCQHVRFREEGSDYHERDRCPDCGAVRIVEMGRGAWERPMLVQIVLDEWGT
jgi:hypothetical protein